MNKFNIHQAKTQFSRLVDLAASGKEIVIAKSGKPVARLIPYARNAESRKLGQLRGKIKIKKNFDAALPAQTLDAFEGKI
jgi:prevent-host-death family protein